MSLYLRRLPQLEYLEPESIGEACLLLREHQGEAKVIAGGTDLLVQMKNRIRTPRYLVNLKRISDLGHIVYDEASGLRIGALAKLRAIETSAIIKEKFTALFEAAYNMASVQIRNLGTIGGNLCNALPSADTVPPLMALDARLKVVGVDGERIVPIKEFFKAPGETVLNGSEILAEIQIDPPPPMSDSTYIKYTLRNAMDLARVGVAVFLKLASSNGKCEDVRIGLAACAPTPIRAERAEQILRGSSLSDEVLERASTVACDESECRLDSFRVPVDYREELIRVLTKRAIKHLIQRMGSRQ